MGRRSKKSLRGRIIPRSKYHQPNMVVRRSMGQEGRSRALPEQTRVQTVGLDHHGSGEHQREDLSLRRKSWRWRTTRRPLSCLLPIPASTDLPLLGAGFQGNPNPGMRNKAKHTHTLHVLLSSECGPKLTWISGSKALHSKANQMIPCGSHPCCHPVFILAK